MKLWRNLLLGLVGVLLLLPTAGLYLVATTETGLRMVAERLGRIGSVTVTAQQVSGTLTRGFTVGSLHIEQRRADIQITNASGRLRLMPLLLERRIELESVDVEHVSVQVLRAAPSDNPRPLRFMAASLRAETDSLTVDSVDLTLINGRTLHGTDLFARAVVEQKVIHVNDARVEWEDMHLEAGGRVHARSPVGFDGKATGNWHPEGKPVWEFETTFDGDLDSLPYQLDVSAPFHAHVEGAATTLNAGWKIAGDGETRDLDISVFGAGSALGIMSASLALSLDSDGFTATGPVTAPGLKAGPIQINARGRYTDHQLILRNSTLRHQPSGTSATVTGVVDVVEGGPRLALSGTWSTLQWPLESAPAFTSSQGSYAISGVKPWQVRAEGIVSAAGIDDMPATMEGSLGTEALAIETATVGLYGGMATVSGEARWSPAESWEVAGRMQQMDAAELRSDLPGRLDFDLRASGAPFGGAGAIDFSVAHLAGSLRDIAATGSGRFIKPAGSDDWQFNDVDLVWGRTHIQLDGSLGAPRDIRFALDADDLSLIDRNARGRVSARGRYAGTDDAPLLLFKARGTDFEWQGISADALEADLDIDLAQAGHAQGKIDLVGIHYGSRTAQQASVEISGSASSQRVNLDVSLAPYRAILVADGTLDNQQWRGSVQSLVVSDDSDLELHLEKPAPVLLDGARFELDELCLAGAQARGCVTGVRNPNGSWNSGFAIQGMPLRAFTAGLSQNMDYEGTINLQGNLANGPDGLPIGTLTGELMGARLLHLLGNGRIEPLSLGTGTVQATATEGSFTARLELDGGTSGDITASLDGERRGSDWQSFPIRGQVSARADALPLLDIYVGGIDKASGQLDTEVTISGTLGSPTWTGQLQLRDASIDVYQIGLALRQLNLTAKFDEASLDLSGQSQLGEGTANFGGSLTWRDNQPYGTLHVNTKDKPLRLVNVPEARIDASPNLDFQLSGHDINATGEVRIVRARLEPADLTNAVLASSDEHLVGEPVTDPEQRWNVTSDIRLILGDDVSIDSFGLKAQLGGSLQVRTDESQISRGTGELNIKSGTYRAYGRLLDIERGRLIFNNVPVNDPGVELRAQKEFASEFSTVTAGVSVRGRLRGTLQVNFFSEPELPQSEIYSLILAGGSLRTAQATDRPGAARNGLMTQGVTTGGAILLQRFGGRIGVDDIGVQSDIDNDTSLVLGKYLTDRLYISYGISLAEAINTFKMRLALGGGWTVKSESGKARSADIVYTFKKGAKKAEEAAKEAAPAQ